VIKVWYLGLCFSDEDGYQDESGIMLDDEPDDALAAYEAFLKMDGKRSE